MKQHQDVSGRFARRFRPIDGWATSALSHSHHAGGMIFAAVKKEFYGYNSHRSTTSKWHWRMQKHPIMEWTEWVRLNESIVFAAARLGHSGWKRFHGFGQKTWNCQSSSVCSTAVYRAERWEFASLVLEQFTRAVRSTNNWIYGVDLLMSRSAIQAFVIHYFP